MSKAATGDQQEFRRPRAARLRRCAGVAIRLGIVSVALAAGIFPVAARGPQIQSFHPLYPTRPPTAHAPSVKPASALAQHKGKLTPEERKRIAKAMSHRTPSRKAPPAQKGGR
jgi:hypothetical protein